MTSSSSLKSDGHQGQVDDGSSPADAVRPFGEISRADVSWAGGKGANLGEMTGAGVPVPGGFVVGAPTYAAFVDERGLRDRLATLLEGLDVDDSDARAARRRGAGAGRGGGHAGRISDAIRAAYKEACEGDAGARRGALVGDRGGHRVGFFAGMNETFLNIKGGDAVVDAVRRCWTSLFGARTVFYRAKRGFGQADMDIAVVVQRQILATRAGVMFTIDPASGATDRLVIEGSFGLGEAVVSGSVSPDRYLVEKDSLAILAREVRSKELVIEPLADGGTVIRELHGDEAKQPVLSDDEVREVAELGRRIEAHYGVAAGHRMVLSMSTAPHGCCSRGR